MARVTVEDCLENVANRFELVKVAAKRVRQITLGGVEPVIDWENDKATVVALREISKGYGYVTRDGEESFVKIEVKSEEIKRED